MASFLTAVSKATHTRVSNLIQEEYKTCIENNELEMEIFAYYPYWLLPQ